MKSVKFVITKEELYGRIFAISAYTTRAREAMGVPHNATERMILTADDKKFIDPFIADSVNEIFTHIIRYHPDSCVDFTLDEYGGYYMFNIKVPESYPTGNEERLGKCIESYMTNHTLQNWYTGIKPDEAGINAVKTQNDAAIIQQLLTQREKPSSSFQEIL